MVIPIKNFLIDNNSLVFGLLNVDNNKNAYLKYFHNKDGIATELTEFHESLEWIVTEANGLCELHGFILWSY